MVYTQSRLLIVQTEVFMEWKWLASYTNHHVINGHGMNTTQGKNN